MVEQWTVAVLWWTVDGFMVDRQTRQLKNKQKTRKKVEKATRDDKKAADSVLKQELHSHHQNGDVPGCPIAEAQQMRWYSLKMIY
jgi:hypothetical protein